MRREGEGEMITRRTARGAPKRGGGSVRTEGDARSGPSLSMTCDRFLLCDSLQLAATPRQPLRFPSSSSSSSSFSSFLLFFLELLLALLPDFRCLGRVRDVHRYAIAPRYIGHLLSSIDRFGPIRSEGLRKARHDPIKTTLRLTAAAEGQSDGFYERGPRYMPARVT